MTMLMLCAVLLPAVALCQVAQTSIESVLSSQLNSLPDRIALVLDQNDYNGDGIIDINDIDVDLLRYQRDNDLCCTSEEEWVEQQMAVYGVTREYATSRFGSFPQGCLSTDFIRQAFGADVQFDYTAFTGLQISGPTTFCGNDTNLLATNRDCQEFVDWALNPTTGICVGDMAARLADQCAQAASNLQVACNGVNTAGVPIPTNVNDNNLPTLAQNCALVNNYVNGRK